MKKTVIIKITKREREEQLLKRERVSRPEDKLIEYVYYICSEEEKGSPLTYYEEVSKPEDGDYMMKYVSHISNEDTEGSPKTYDEQREGKDETAMVPRKMSEKHKRWRDHQVKIGTIQEWQYYTIPLSEIDDQLGHRTGVLLTDLTPEDPAWRQYDRLEKSEIHVYAWRDEEGIKGIHRHLGIAYQSPWDRGEFEMPEDYKEFTRAEPKKEKPKKPKKPKSS